MSLVSEFFGIKIYMYWEDHMPPHFHAEYGEYAAQIDIVETVVLKGLFPNKQLKLVLAWCELHKEELVKNWKLAATKDQIDSIEPLR